MANPRKRRLLKKLRMEKFNKSIEPIIEQTKEPEKKPIKEPEKEIIPIVKSEEVEVKSEKETKKYKKITKKSLD